MTESKDEEVCNSIASSECLLSIEARHETKGTDTSYPFSDDLVNAERYVATITLLNYHSINRGFVPVAESETATLTFIAYQGNTYAVTARHVIKALDNLATKNGRRFAGYMCLQSPGIGICGPFLTPPRQLLEPEPDIAICPVNKNLPASIGKIPFEIRSQDDAKWPVTHALAVGFPTLEKHDSRDEEGWTRLTIPCVYAVAEGLNSSGRSDQVQFHSALSSAPSVVSLSGMSGGPVFWSDGTYRGLIGFVKEALDITPKEGSETFYTDPKVNFICERIDYEIIERWLKFVDENWDKEREKINVAIQNRI